MVNEGLLKKLAELFPPSAPLYAVGGYVRDKLLNIECHDVDICSKLTVDDVKSLLLTSEFAVSDKNLRVGTVIISCKGFHAEYTTFRTDSYPEGSGVHTPSNVVFTDDINVDARRRDFKCNAVYLNPLSGEIIDPLGGTEDIKKHVLRAADTPDKVFSEDGLRILRMVRFSVELGFSIDKETFAAAKRYAPYVLELAPERITEELNKIFVADTAHRELYCVSAHAYGLMLLDQLDLLEKLLPEVNALKGLQQNPEYHLFDACVHSLECYRVAPPRLRWAALFHDVGKRPCMERDGNMYAHASVGAELAEIRFNALRRPKADIKRDVSLIALHMVNLNGDMSESKMRWFVAEHAAIAADLADLKDADAVAAKGRPLKDNWVRRILKELKDEGAPLAVRELKVDGNDLIGLNIEERSRGIILYELWRDTVMNPVLNDREKALSYLRKRSEKNE